MKPIIKIVYNGAGALIDMSLKGKEFQSVVEKKLTDKRYEKIISCPLQLYITLTLNPSTEILTKAYQQDGGVYVEVSPSLQGDGNIYSLQLGLSRIKPPEGVENVLIHIDDREKPSNTMDDDGNSDELKYIAVTPGEVLDDIVLPETILHKLMRASKIIKNRDVILNTLGYSKVDKNIKSIICFYGPAGTGKTKTAKAIANFLNKKIVISSYAQIESKYVGDGAKNLRKIFEDTTKQDAVLFMDECDSFLSKRIESTDSGSDKHYNRMSNELFQLLEDHTGCIIFATNLLTDIDKAFKSRIVDSIYFPLPDKDCRVKILQKMVLPKIIESVFPNEEDLGKFAEELDGFSGRDIRKSVLITLAEISDEVVEKGLENVVWTLEKFRVGFDDVRNTFSGDTDNSESIPLDELQGFLDKKRFRQKQFELAKHAVLVDEGIDDREYLLLQDLSQQLMNVELDNKDVSPEMDLPEICDGIADVNQKRVLVDTAIRVVAIDGEFSDNEKQFISKLCGLLGFSDEETSNFVVYGETMANAYSHWIKAIENDSQI